MAGGDDKDKPRKTAKVLDFTPAWSGQSPMEAIRHAENEIRQGRFDNIFVVLHRSCPDGSSDFFTLKNDMPFDAKAACAMWLMSQVMNNDFEEVDP